MLELQDICVEIGPANLPQRLLEGVSLSFPQPHFGAIIGPSGCGKSTLLKTIAGLISPSDGLLKWAGRDLLTEGDLAPSELGYVPQFNIAHEALTVRETLLYTLLLRQRMRSGREREDRLDRVMRLTGLSHLSARPSRVLSGGERRRLALAMEITSNPSLLLCDEVTSGLDPKSEEDISLLLRDVSRDGGRVVLNITHSLKHVALYDSVTVLKSGRLVFFGSNTELLTYFNIHEPDEVFRTLESRTGPDWNALWVRHQEMVRARRNSIRPGSQRPARETITIPRDDEDEVQGHDATPPEPAKTQHVEPEEAHLEPGEMEEEMHGEELAVEEEGTADGHEGGELEHDGPLLDEEHAPEEAEYAEEEIHSEETDEADGEQMEAPLDEAPPAYATAPTPGLLSQFVTLSRRRWLLFFREKSQIGLQILLLFLFPCLVALFAWHGLPQIHQLNLRQEQNIFQELKDNARFMEQATKTGSLVSGIVMFQVVLLALMASNNSAREVSGERLIFEKEKLAGLRPAGYLASKIVFLTALVTVQSFWMTLFVKFVCDFPGTLLEQLGMLFLVNAAVTALCLAISSWARTNEQASLASIYMVGFQLPLSGAVLALPEGIRSLTQLFIASYWSWSGVIQSMRDTRYYEVVKLITDTPLNPLPFCFWVLTWHVILSLFVAYLGCTRSQWEG